MINFQLCINFCPQQLSHFNRSVYLFNFTTFEGELNVD